MKIELNANELEVAVIAHLSNSGLDLKKKTITFEFEGMCSIDIEAEDNTAPTAKKAPVKRAARKPKEEVKEPTKETAEETVAVEKPKKAAAKPKVEEVVEPEPTEEKVEKPSAAALFNTAPSEDTTSTNTDDGDNADEDTSLFG